MRSRSPHCAHECFWVDQAWTGGLLYPFSGTTVVIDIQNPAVLGWHAKRELWVWPSLHIRRRDVSRFQLACWVVREDAAASVATAIALIENVHLTNQLKVFNIHWTKIMIIKYTFPARNVIKTHIHAQTILKNDIIHGESKECQPRQTEAWLPVWYSNRAGCCALDFFF